MIAENIPAQTEQIPANLNDYGTIIEAGTLDRGISNRLNWLISDLEKLSMAAQDLRSEISRGAL